MFVIAHRGLFNPEVIEQVLRLPRVLASDQINLLQHSNRVQGDVFQVADGRGNEI